MKNFTSMMLGLGVWLAMVVHAWSDQERGLLVYQEPPGSYVEVLRFTSIAPSTAYATLVSPSGDIRHCWNGGLLAEVDYPNPDEAIDPYQAGEHIKQIQPLINTYPQYKYQLQGALAKWQNALSVAKQMQAARPAPAATSGTQMPSLDVKGTQYEQVSLTGVTGSTASITYSGGVDSLQLADLTPAQIKALNATSSSVQIDSDWQKKAVADFPDLGVAGSGMNQRFVTEFNSLKYSNPRFFDDPRWPYVLAKQVSQAPIIPGVVTPPTAQALVTPGDITMSSSNAPLASQVADSSLASHLRKLSEIHTLLIQRGYVPSSFPSGKNTILKLEKADLCILVMADGHDEVVDSLDVTFMTFLLSAGQPRTDNELKVLYGKGFQEMLDLIKSVAVSENTDDVIYWYANDGNRMIKESNKHFKDTLNQPGLSYTYEYFPNQGLMGVTIKAE